MSYIGRTFIKKVPKGIRRRWQGGTCPPMFKIFTFGVFKGIGFPFSGLQRSLQPPPPPSSEQPKCIASSKGISADTHGSTKHTLGTCFGNGGSLKGSDYYVARVREPYPDLYSYGTGQQSPYGTQVNSGSNLTAQKKFYPYGTEVVPFRNSGKLR